MKPLKFKPHSPKQDKAIFSRKPIVLCATGIQWGKTTVGALKTKLALHEFGGPDEAHIITAPTYKIMEQSTLPAFLRLMDGWGKYSKGDSVFTYFSGARVYCRTETDPDSVVGITNVRSIWGDEAGKYGLYFWENLQARAAFRNAQVTLTTSPYTLNWVYKDYIKKFLKDNRSLPNVELVRARSDENPYFPKSVYDDRKATMDSRRFNMMFGGEWEKHEGLVYDCFDDDNLCDQFAFPAGTKFIGGLDWGFTNPFVFALRAITPDGKHYQPIEIYKTQKHIQDIVILINRVKANWPVTRIYADPSNPSYIAQITEQTGIPCEPANNDISLGIDLHYELIKTKRYKVFKKYNPFTVDEYESYHYPDESEINEQKDEKERQPVKRNDHSMDANRYITIATVNKKDFLPTISEEINSKKKETNSQRIERLKKLSNNEITENWS